MTTRKKAVAETKTELPVIAGLEDYEGVGGEEVTSADLAIPFLRLVQSNSPQAKKSSPDYIEGIEEGDILNTATGQFWKADEGITVLPVYYRREKLEFILQSEGGGFVGAHPADAVFRTEKNENGRDVIAAGEPNAGNEILDTMQFFVIALPEGGEPFLAMMGLSRTQTKYGKRWLTACVQNYNGRRPPMWMFKWHLTSRFDHKDDHTWASWNIAKVSEEPWFTDVQDPLFQLCAEAYQNIRSDSVKVDRSQMTDAPSEETNEEDAPAY